MEAFALFLSGIENELHRERMQKVFQWIEARFPNLERRFAWNQPMFTDHGTFIIGFSVAKHHFAIAPERAGMETFAEEIKASGYDQSTKIFRIKWTQPIDYALLERIIVYNMQDKAGCSTFWRK